MNIFKFTLNGKEVKFTALSIQEAYEKAGRLVNDMCSDISDESSSYLDDADMDNWNDIVIPKLSKLDNIKLSDIQELDED